LGDFFDLIRTRSWWTVEEDRWRPKKIAPWWNHNQGIEKETLKIVRNIIKKNEATLNAVRELPSKLGEKYSNIEEVEIIYVPGNHNRLVTISSIWDEAKKS
jgi:hypothetical protein